MRRIAGTALTTAAAFLSLVAILIDAPGLFYMGFALISLLIACNLQSAWAAKGLRIERVAPKSVHVGEFVTIELVIWSERKLKRPLVTVIDNVNPKLARGGIGPSLPIAPAFDLPVRTMYQFRAAKRGTYRWKNISVTATDALGLTIKTVNYITDPTEITVLPVPIPVNIELPSSAGWGINEAQSGQAAGAGIEPRGVRPYANGDSLRHVHWRSSARMGSLMVKEFQAGSYGSCSFVIQASQGSDIGKGDVSSLDVICGHTLFLAEELLRKGVTISFPNLTSTITEVFDADRIEGIAVLLGALQADSERTVGEDLETALTGLRMGSTVFICVTVNDGSLDPVLAKFRQTHTLIPLIYDPKTYDPSFKGKSAADSENIDQLMGLGLNPIMMPEYNPL